VSTNRKGGKGSLLTVGRKRGGCPTKRRRVSSIFVGNKNANPQKVRRGKRERRGARFPLLPVRQYEEREKSVDRPGQERGKRVVTKRKKKKGESTPCGKKKGKKEGSFLFIKEGTSKGQVLRGRGKEGRGGIPFSPSVKEKGRRERNTIIASIRGREMVGEECAERGKNRALFHGGIEYFGAKEVTIWSKGNKTALLLSGERQHLRSFSFFKGEITTTGPLSPRVEEKKEGPETLRQGGKVKREKGRRPGPSGGKEKRKEAHHILWKKEADSRERTRKKGATDHFYACCPKRKEKKGRKG